MYWGLLKFVEENGYDLTTIRENMKVCTSGGAPMPVEVMKEFESISACAFLKAMVCRKLRRSPHLIILKNVETRHGRTGEFWR
jgi:acyl-CoA synthetase (AMP-forming)/AMP-acid ligase II